ncbi:MAG: peptidyl-prolyl cis-trans isomerase [Deltaproteobacteria bacterium]|nr:peptidyl-prolyl cis-trans isomerase [Deltaproteobacteria bacterium]
MRGIRCSLLLAGLIGLSLVFTVHAPGEVVNRIVAIVDDDIITLYELNKRIKEVTGLAPNALRLRSEEQYLTTRRQVLELLIDEKITQKKIHELGIRISKGRIDSTIERIKEENGWTQEDLVKMLKEQGLTLEKYREEIKKGLERVELINREVKSRIVIREEEIRKYYEDHKDRFRADERVHLAGIFLIARSPDDREEMQELEKKGKRILLELRNGGDFASMAKMYSQGPGADKGGDLGKFRLDELDPALGEALRDLREGEYSKLIRRPNGFQIFRLLKREGGQYRPFEEVRDAVYRVLYNQEVDHLYSAWIKELRSSSYTKIVF